MERPQKELRKPELLYIVGCEGKNQEKKYFERVQYIINSIPSRRWNVLFDFAEPFGGNSRCVVERTINKSIGKSNKVAVFDYDGKRKEYEEALELAKENKIELGNTNYCFDLWLILHKEDYFHSVSHQDDYANDLRRVFGLLADSNIKKEANVNRIVSQIDLSDIITAIKRADKIVQDNLKKTQHLTPNTQIAYYDNPDTQMHIALKTIFHKTGIKMRL